MARAAEDSLPPGVWLNMSNWSELTENTMSSRNGSIIINRTGNVINALPAPVHSLAKLSGYAPQAWRYAGAGTVLYRRAGTSQGAYTSLATGMSGQAWSYAVYRPNLSSYPYAFFADLDKMLKDNGTTGAQQWGIFQPQTPVQAQLQPPLFTIIDEFNGAGYTFNNVTNHTAAVPRYSGTTSSAIVPGINTVTVVGGTAGLAGMEAFQLLDVGGAGAETVLVLEVTPASFTANFVNAHASGVTLSSLALSINVAASTTGTVTKTGALDLSKFANGTLTTLDDYIGFAANVSDPSNLQELRIQFDVSDGTFTQSYFEKIIAPSVYQPSASELDTPADTVTQAVYASTIGIYGAGQGQVFPLLTGSVWTQIFAQFSDFTANGQADFNDPIYNWSNVKAYRLVIITNTNGIVASTQIDDLIMFGGAGPDSLGGTDYNWLYTYYNSVTGAESNPSMFMSNANPPTDTTWITPRRQGVKLTLVPSTDPQVTNIKVYRQGGTLDNTYLQCALIPANTTTYIDTASDADIEGADPISLTNDVPVTSTLKVPVNTTLSAALTPTGTGQVLTITPPSMTGISVNQQVTLGSDIDLNQEVVIVQSIHTAGFPPLPVSFTAFVQNPHLSGDPVTAEATYGQPLNIVHCAFNQMWWAGDPNNPHYLYYSPKTMPEYCGSANFIEVGTPDNPITDIWDYAGTLFVRTVQYWQAIAPGSQENATPSPYPTQTAHGGPGINASAKTESGIWFQALDGLREFDTSSAVYKTLNVEFIFQPQENGLTPIPIADPAAMNFTSLAYYNNVVYCAYESGGVFYRLNWHVLYQRWRNDTVPATAMLVEEDTNTLVWGDVSGVIHQDNIGFYDEANNAGALIEGAIPLNLQSAYLDQGAPRTPKQYQNLNLDLNTNGQTLTWTLLFDDGLGTITPVTGTVNTTSRQKVNLPVNGDQGMTGYRVSVQITGAVTNQVIIYQSAIEGLILAEARKVWDTFWETDGILDSKIAKDVFIEYTATNPVVLSAYYDQGANAPGNMPSSPVFQITMPPSPRRSVRFRLPALKFRLRRVTAISQADFQIWDADMRIKPVLSTSGYRRAPLFTSGEA